MFVSGEFFFFLSFTTSRLYFCWIPLTTTEKQQQKRKIREVEVSLWGAKLGSGGEFVVPGTRAKKLEDVLAPVEVRVHIWSTAEVPLSKVQNPPNAQNTVVSCDELARPGLEH